MTLESVIAELKGKMIRLHQRASTRLVVCSADVLCVNGMYPYFVAGLENGKVLFYTRGSVEEVLLTPELAGHPITAVHRGRYLWVAEKEGSLIKFENNKLIGQVTTRHRFMPPCGKFQNDYFMAIHEQDGRIYAGTAIGGMYVLNNETLQLPSGVETLLFAARGITKIKATQNTVYFLGKDPHHVDPTGRPVSMGANMQNMPDMTICNETAYAASGYKILQFGKSGKIEKDLELNSPLTLIETVKWNSGEALLIRTQDNEMKIVNPQTLEEHSYQALTGRLAIL